MVLDQIEERLVVALDAEAVRERRGHDPPGTMGVLCGESERLLGFGRIEQVPLEVDHRRAPDPGGIDVFRAEVHRGTEIGVHGALRIRGDQDEAAAGRGALR